MTLTEEENKKLDTLLNIQELFNSMEFALGEANDCAVDLRKELESFDDQDLKFYGISLTEDLDDFISKNLNSTRNTLRTLIKDLEEKSIAKTK